MLADWRSLRKSFEECTDFELLSFAEVKLKLLRLDYPLETRAGNPLKAKRLFRFSAPWKTQAHARSTDTAKKTEQIKIQEVWKVTLQ